MGRILLPIFGSNCARCLTSPIDKQLLTTLSRTKWSKDCTTDSRMRFAHAPQWRLGPRSYPFCSLDSGHSQGKKLVFPHLKQFLVLPLCCLKNSCKMKKFLLILFSKKISKTLDVPAVSLPRHNSSAQLPSELPTELLSAPLVWVHRGGIIPPLQPLYDGPTPFCTVDPSPSPSKSGPGKRSSPLTASRPARLRTPSLAARGRPPGSRPGCPAASNQVSFSDPLVSSSPPVPSQDGPGTVFLPGEEVLHAWDRRCLHSLHRCGTRPINRHSHRG